MLAFGPDGCLYVGAGDGGGGGDTHASAQCPYGNGQCLDTELGKILRIDVDHPGTGAPGDLAGAGLPYLWDYGLRNPWRFSFDRATGDLYIGDVGQEAWEELDIELAGTGHRNYGWRITEGKHCSSTATDGSGACTDHGVDYAYANFDPPVHDYPHAAGNNCIIGGYVYRGINIPSLNGYYLYADFGSGRVWALAWNGEDTCAAPIDLSGQLIVSAPTSFGEDSDGELYITTANGEVFRIDPA
jgi:glucose/arabinose dehydrogenase